MNFLQNAQEAVAGVTGAAEGEQQTQQQVCHGASLQQPNSLIPAHRFQHTATGEREASHFCAAAACMANSAAFLCCLYSPRSSFFTVPTHACSH